MLFGIRKRDFLKKKFFIKLFHIIYYKYKNTLKNFIKTFFISIKRLIKLQTLNNNIYIKSLKLINV